MTRISQLILFLAAVALLAAAGSTSDSIFNNFLSDTFKISAEKRGWLEFPRELPGFLAVLMTGVLAALPVTRLGMVGAGVLALGLIGLAFLGTAWSGMLVMMVLASSGLHLLMPVGSSIAVGITKEENRGKRLGQMGAIGTLGTIAGTGAVWLLFDRENPAYGTAFLCAGVIAAIAAVFYSLLHIPHLHQPRARLVVRRKFGLYYLLELVFGARKQIFITFGPWVLIREYGEPASAIAGLIMTAALLNLAFSPLAGMAIDRLGERKVLMFDAIVLIFVCAGYGYAKAILPDESMARNLACTCYVLDMLLFSLGSGRTVYASRLADSPQELTSTLAMGVSVNHIISMSIPAVAGALWEGFGYQRVFLAAAVLSVMNAVLCGWIPRKDKFHAETAGDAEEI